MPVLRWSLVLAAGLGMGAPATGAPVPGLDLVSICTAHGADLIAVPQEGDPADRQERRLACHAACPSAVQQRGKGRGRP